jgi:hypothetical protein
MRRSLVISLLLLPPTVGAELAPRAPREARLAALHRACVSQRDGPSCMALAKRYEVGDGVRKNRLTAVEYCRLACDRDVARGCRRAGDRLRGITQALGDHYYGRACRLGLRPACAARRRLGPGRVDAALARWERDPSKARILRELRRERAACLEGDPGACRELLPVCGAGERCARERLPLERLLCISGHGPTCDALGEVYQRGLRGVVADRNAAERLFDRACALGYQGGCLRLATLHRSHARYFARRDAVERHARACRAGSVTDCLAAARGYREVIEPTDAAAARTYARLACKLGSVEACARRIGPAP